MNGVGVIGVGIWGRKHVEEYIKLGYPTFVADISETNLQSCKEKFPVAGTYRDFKALLQNPDIKYVSICTPNATHYEVAKAALEHGKHALVEKPFVLKNQDGKKLVDLAKEKNVNIVVGHVFRFSNVVNAVRQLLKNDDLGKPYILKFSWTNLEPFYHDVIFDLAPHPFDIANYLLEEDPSEISCVGGSYREKAQPGAPEAAFINYRIKKIIVHIEISRITPRKKRDFVLVCSDKTVFADCLNQKLSLHDNRTNSPLPDMDIVSNNTLQDELKSFISCSDSSIKSVASAEIGTKIVHLLELAETSLKNKRTMHVDF
jgi:UDP-N-acetylglucosamine 3-dehydrogenase